jgi:hypothetical protein
MTDVPPRRRIVTLKRVIWALLILCGAGAAWVYEAGAFDRAARADLDRRGAIGGSWPKYAYEANLRKVRDPRAAEEAVPEKDSVSYFRHDRGDGAVLAQVFHVTLRQGLRRWRRQLTVIYDEYPAPERIATNYTELPGPRLTRQAALAWYDDWRGRQHEWRTENAQRLVALKVNLLLLEGKYEELPTWGWSFEPDSAELYRQILTSIYRFGDAGIEMLVDCLNDAGPATARVVNDGVPGEPVRAGTICHYILKDMVRFEDDVQESETVVIDGERSSEWLGDLRKPADAARLAAGEAAWRARMKRGNFHFERPNDIGY